MSGDDKIPEINHDDLRRLAQQIKPVTTKEGIQYVHEQRDVVTQSFMGAADKDLAAPELEEYFSTVTFHRYGHPMMFKPSIAEVLAQIPTQMLEKITAFESHPISMDPNSCVEGDYHVATTKFYMGKLPEKAEKQDVMIRGKCYKYGADDQARPNDKITAEFKAKTSRRDMKDTMAHNKKITLRSRRQGPKP